MNLTDELYMQETGFTFSQDVYTEYKKNGDAELFEKLVADLILNKFSEDKEITEYISKLPRRDQRLAILSLIDKETKGDSNLIWSEMKSFVDSAPSKMEHIKDVIRIINKFVKDGNVEKKKFGEVMTPITLVREMLDTLPKEVWSNPNLKWLDPCNGPGTFPFVVIYKLMNGLSEWEPDENKRYKHIVENMIYTCELQSRNVFLWLCGVDPYDEYTTNTYWGSFLDEGFDTHMREVWGLDKFDVVMGNPPFNQMIDMLFLQNSYHISDKVIFVHPSTWLLDEKNKQKKFIETKELIKVHLESILLFNGNNIFNIQLFIPCVFTYINKNKTKLGIECLDKINNITIKYNDINQINKFSDVNIYKDLKKKISSLTVENIDDYKIFNISTKRNNTPGKILKHLHLNTINEYYINIAQIRGHVDLKSETNMLLDDFYTIVTKDNKVERKISNHMFFKFENKQNAENFLNYLKTDFARFCLSVYKNNSQLECGEMSFIPWLDFECEWTDEKLFKYFNLNSDEVHFIKSKIPKYY